MLRAKIALGLFQHYPSGADIGTSCVATIAPEQFDIHKELRMRRCSKSKIYHPVGAYSLKL
jgi:hypothetical protein